MAERLALAYDDQYSYLLTANVTLSDNITVVTKAELKSPSEEYF